MNAPEHLEAERLSAAHHHSRRGFLFGVAAYGLWGFLPIYFKLLKGVAAVDIVAHRVLWSLPFLALLFPFAAAWLAWRTAAGAPSFGSTGSETGLLVLAGIVSTTPLVLFTAAARKLPYSTLGMLQFIAPTLQFLIAVLLYHEPFRTAHAIAFAAIWSALALYVTALVRAPRLPQPPE